MLEWVPTNICRSYPGPVAMLSEIWSGANLKLLMPHPMSTLGFKLQGKLQLGMRKNVLTTRMAKYRNRLPRKTVESLSLVDFKSRLNKHCFGMVQMMMILY